MTNEEAIKVLKSDRDYLYTNNRGNDKPCYNEEAYTIAIKALEERPKGKWINGLNGTFECSRCGIKHSKAHFCPNCGAQMER